METRWNEAAQKLEIRRLDRWCVAHNHAMAQALRCNHDVQVMNSSVSGMYAAVTYVTNYTTKSDITLHDLLDLTRVAVEKYHSQNEENEKNGVVKSVNSKTRSLVMKCFHGTTG